MNYWLNRPAEAQRLLNPSFCSLLLWHAAYAHAEATKERDGLAFEECFLILPMVLHRETRESLPKKSSTSIPIWLGINPLSMTTIANRAISLVPYTKEALRFGGAYGLLKFNATLVCANREWSRRVESTLKDSSDEVCICTNRAEFIGKWFAKTGNVETVLSFFGLQP